MADLYVTLTANTAGLTAGFTDAAVVVESRVAAILAAVTELDAAFATMGAPAASAAAEVDASTAAMAAGVQTAAAGVTAADTEMATAASAAAARVSTAEAEIAAAAQASAAKVTAASAEASTAMTGMAGRAQAAAAKQVESAGILGGALSKTQLGMVGVGVAVGAVSVKMAADFEVSTQRLVTSANESQANLGMVRDGMLAMMGSLGFSADQLSTAMYKVESSGQKGADALTVLKAAAQGAKNENADLTTVADAVTTALFDYRLKASDASLVTSKMVQATASGKMTFQELAGSLSSVAPLASTAGISLNDMLGVLASMTIRGISAQQATQNMADAIRQLQSPSQVSTKAMAILGVDAQDVAAKLGQRGLAGTMQFLADKVKSAMPPGSDPMPRSVSRSCC